MASRSRSAAWPYVCEGGEGGGGLSGECGLAVVRLRTQVLPSCVQRRALCLAINGAISFEQGLVARRLTLNHSNLNALNPPEQRLLTGLGARLRAPRPEVLFPELCVVCDYVSLYLMKYCV